MGTKGHIIYETPDGNYIMRTQLSDAYIPKPGLGKALLDSFTEEKYIKEIFDMNMDFSTISENEIRYKEKEVKSIKENGIKKHKQYNLSLFDKLAFVNGRAIKCVNFLDNKKAENLIFTNLKDCQKACTESYVYLYRQESKSWFLQLEHGFIDLKSAHYINSKLRDVVNIEEMIDNNEKLIKSPKLNSVPLTDKQLNILEFKKSKISHQILTFIDINQEDNQRRSFFNEKVYGEEYQPQLERMQDKYHLYLLNRKLNKTLDIKPIETKKLKI